MANEKLLPKENALALLRKLADDDAFRHRYEANPVHALREVIPPDVLGQLPPGHEASIKLAPKTTFQEALYQVIDNVSGVCLCHTPPQITLSFGESKSGTPHPISFKAS